MCITPSIATLWMQWNPLHMQGSRCEGTGNHCSSSSHTYVGEEMGGLWRKKRSRITRGRYLRGASVIENLNYSIPFIRASLGMKVFTDTQVQMIANASSEDSNTAFVLKKECVNAWDNEWARREGQRQREGRKDSELYTLTASLMHLPIILLVPGFIAVAQDHRLRPTLHAIHRPRRCSPSYHVAEHGRCILHVIRPRFVILRDISSGRVIACA